MIRRIFVTQSTPPRENYINLYPQEDIFMQKTSPKYIIGTCKGGEGKN